MKRVIDIVGSLVGIIIFGPVMVIIAGCVKFNDLGPVFFRQQRLGRYGQKFQMYKFRTMVVDAEKVLRSDNQLYAEYINNSFSLAVEKDPRITKIGRFLRSSSLDELPQLFNVLKGEMSLVGPRPILEAEIKYYGQAKDKFLSLKPGITGYWQAYGRDDITYPERVDVEMHYVYQHNLWLDFKIIFKTFGVVIRRRGVR